MASTALTCYLSLQTVETTLLKVNGELGFSIAGGRGSLPYKGNDEVRVELFHAGFSAVRIQLLIIIYIIMLIYFVLLIISVL